MNLPSGSNQSFDSFLYSTPYYSLFLRLKTDFKWSWMQDIVLMT